MFSILVLASLLQEEVKIPRSAKEPYTKAVPECERALGLIESGEAQAALEILNGIIENSKIDRKECRICWEIQSGTYSRWYDFLPYQYRGRARIKLAEKLKTSDKERARAHLEKAVEDLQTSVDRGVRKSEDYKSEAKRLLATLGGGGGGPVKEFETDLRKLIDEKNFAEARQFVEGERGKFLTEAQRKTYLDETTDRCRAHIDSSTARFVEALRSLYNLRQLETMKDAIFDRDFGLPARSTLIEAAVTPEFVWCAEFHPVLKDLKGRKDALDALLRGAVKLVPLVIKSGDFGWFASLERLGHELVRGAISQRADDARRETSSERRTTLRQEAEKFRDRWQLFESEVRKAASGKEAFLSRIETRDFAAAFDGFPIEAAGIGEILAGVRKSADAEDPERALAELETRLERFRDDWDRLLPDSRRDVLACRVVVAALRAFLDGRTVAQVATDLKSLGAELKGLGGRAEERRFGRKVHLVFQELLK